MNRILNIAITAFFFIAVSSCNKESEGVSRITSYVDIELEGGSTVFSQIGQSFTEPGFTAVEGDKDLTGSVAVNSTVNTSEAGVYNITYSAVNSDGFPASKIRTVVVCDKNAKIPYGYYQSNIRRNNAGTIANRGPFTVLFFGMGNEEYYVQDLLGRWYDVGSTYGPDYAGAGIIKLKADNTFELVSSEALAFSAGSAPQFSATSTYDPVTKSMILNTIMGDTPTMLFRVTLTNPSPLN